MLLKLHVHVCFCVFFICLFFFLNRVTVVAVASNVLYVRTSTVRDLWAPFIASPF